MSLIEQLADFTLFERLSEAQRSIVARATHETAFPTDTTIFEEGQDAVGCWLIRSGQVALTMNVAGRGRVIVQTLGPGDVLGWSWLVPSHHWHWTATTTGPVSAFELDTRRLRVLADEDPVLGYPLALGLFEVLLGRLQSTRLRLLDLYGSPRER
jgi:CRP/FNR family cyclic AMP-dependent transcriptional regulator